MHKRTKIVCTIGPASKKKAVLVGMAKAGMDVARLNFSHGTYAEHKVLLNHVRSASRAAGKAITIMQDLQGPRIRIGDLKQELVWKKGDQVVLDGSLAKQKDVRVPVTYPRLSRDIQKGDRILVEDGKKVLRVTRVQGSQVACLVVVGGPVISHKGLNFPDSQLSVDPITVKDKKDLAFGLQQKVDYVVMSFVRSAAHIKRLRKLLGKHPVGIVAKVETREALEHISEIVAAADAVMIGRGDLALEIDFAEVPLWQKKIVALCRRAGKPVIVATQMLESMMHGVQPSRADVSDIANAVIDRTDAVMLSGESAMGDDPVNIVATMAHIIEETESSPYDDVLLSTLLPSDKGLAVRAFAQSAKAEAVVLEQPLVQDVADVSRARPELPIMIITKEAGLQRRLNLYWGVDGALKPKVPKKAVRVTQGKIR
jgi:pyruvate kinase